MKNNQDSNKNNNKKNRIPTDQHQKPYFMDKFATIKPQYKIGFLKYWMAGVCYFLAFMTTEAVVSTDTLDQFAIILLLYTLGNEYVVNNLVFYMNRPDQYTLDHLPFKINESRKKFLGLAATLGYSALALTFGFLLHLGVWHVFDFFNIPTLAYIIHGDPNGLDPFTFALYCLLFACLWKVARKYINRKKEDNTHDQS